jgi:ABC-type glycerol-3-phosphate transport system substrate-binding protein
MYQASGGAVQDEQGRPYLDAETLTSVLTFMMDAESTGVMPFGLTQYQSDDQVWEVFQEGRTDMVFTWCSHYLEMLVAETEIGIAPLPTSDGQPYTMASGWVWALVTSDEREQELSVELAEFLSDTEFLADWTLAVGYLPTRPTALSTWSELPLQSVLDRIARSARLHPSLDIMTSLGALLEQATVQVLKQQSDPTSAAHSAVESLSSP